VLAIGFTGHRSLPDEATSRESIRGFLREQKAKTAAIVYGVSSAATGGDLLFAESCLELEIPLRILLPLSKEEFRKDFDAAAWLRAEEVMSKAVSVEVTGNGVLRMRNRDSATEPAHDDAVGRGIIERHGWDAGDKRFCSRDGKAGYLDS
jgi:hypothetical protein